MTTARSEMLKAKARDVLPDLARATDIAAKAAAANRPLTRDERTTYDAAMAKAAPVLQGLRSQRNDASITEYVRSEFGGIGGPPNGAKHGQRLSFKNMAAGISNRMITGEFGQKALAPSGATVVAQGFVEDPIALGRAATNLLDVLPVTVQSSPEYAYLRQTTRTNNAAVVDEGDTKPTSVLGLTRIEASLAVVAHLSEGFPRQWMASNGAIEAFVNSELTFGLLRAVETKVIADVNGTSGIQAQAWSVSIAQTLRKALTKIEVAGLSAGAIVLHPSDFELVELALSTTNAVEHQGLPYDAARRVLFGVPIATTVSATAGVGHVIAADSVVLDTDAAGVQILWSETSNATDFATNTIRARCESSYGTSVLSPLGVVVADLTA
jgi:HK97 family phage major capsid protein